MTRPSSWQTPTAVETLPQLEILTPIKRVEDSRDDWDILPRLIQAGGASGHKALKRIASFAHRGWLDVLLSLEDDVYKHDLVGAWREALEACVGPSGPALGDRDILRALSQSNRYINRLKAS